MAIACAKVTSQGQISVPADVRRKLGIGPGSLLEWVEEDGKMLIRRSGHFSSEDIHRALFGKRTPQAVTVNEMKAGIRSSVRKRHARD